MINFLISMVPAWIFQVIVFVSFFAMCYGAASVFMTSTMTRSSKIVLVGLFLLFQFGAYLMTAKSFYEKQMSATELNNAIITENIRLKKELQESSNVKIITEYKDRIIQLAGETRIVKEKIPVYITKEIEAKCELDDQVARYHDEVVDRLNK